jgi:hypothetical protein
MDNTCQQYQSKAAVLCRFILIVRAQFEIRRAHFACLPRRSLITNY